MVRFEFDQIAPMVAICHAVTSFRNRQHVARKIDVRARHFQRALLRCDDIEHALCTSESTVGRGAGALAGGLIERRIRLTEMKPNQYDDSCLHANFWGKSATRLTATARARKAEVLDCLNRLHPALQHIVNQELKRGNLVSDAGNDYPHQGSIHVTMSERFDDRYDSAAAPFSLCNDPHYWHADYSTIEQPSHLLLC
jgi:hypothetical protein